MDLQLTHWYEHMHFNGETVNWKLVSLLTPHKYMCQFFFSHWVRLAIIKPIEHAYEWILQYLAMCKWWAIILVQQTNTDYDVQFYWLIVRQLHTSFYEEYSMNTEWFLGERNIMNIFFMYILMKGFKI